MCVYQRGTVANITLLVENEKTPLFHCDTFLGFFQLPKNHDESLKARLFRQIEPAILNGFKKEAADCLKAYERSVKDSYQAATMIVHLAKIKHCQETIDCLGSIPAIADTLNDFIGKNSLEGYYLEVDFANAVIVPTA